MPTPSAAQLLSNLPPGYSVCQAPDGVPYIVPNYFVPATDLALRCEEQKSALNIHLAAGGVRRFQFLFPLVSFGCLLYMRLILLPVAVVAGEYELPCFVLKSRQSTSFTFLNSHYAWMI